MPKIVKSWDEWSPLKRVIGGRPEGTNVPAPEPAWWYDLPRGGFPLPQYGPFPQDMVDAANEQMDYFYGQIEKRGAIVDRIDIHAVHAQQAAAGQGLGWIQMNAHGVNNVRDVCMIHGHYILDCTTVRRSRVYERFNLRPIFDKYVREDPEAVHFSAPFPMLTDESYVRNYYYDFEHTWTDEEKLEKLHKGEFQLTDRETLMDAADAMRFGKDVFHQVSCVTNPRGFEWLQRMFKRARNPLPRHVLRLPAVGQREAGQLPPVAHRRELRAAPPGPLHLQPGLGTDGRAGLRALQDQRLGAHPGGPPDQGAQERRVPDRPVRGEELDLDEHLLVRREDGVRRGRRDGVRRSSWTSSASRSSRSRTRRSSRSAERSTARRSTSTARASAWTTSRSRSRASDRRKARPARCAGRASSAPVQGFSPLQPVGRADVLLVVDDPCPPVARPLPAVHSRAVERIPRRTKGACSSWTSATPFARSSSSRSRTPCSPSSPASP